jgi:prophage DNA circulation protein
MSLNLNNPADFATATLSNLSTALSNLLGSSQWSIQEAAYGVDPNNLVLFHVFKTNENYTAALDQVQDVISRRVPEYKFPYVDGQGTDDLGREASTYEFDAIIHGPNYYNAYVRLINELNKPFQGTLRHPVNGLITVKFTGGRVTHRSKERQAVILHMTFVESNVNISLTTTKPTLKTTLANAAAFLSSVASQITQVQGYAAVASSALLAANATIASFSAGFTSFLVSLNTSFNNGTSADLPGLLPANSAAGTTSFPVATATTGVYADLTPAEIQAQTTAPVSAAQAQILLSDLVTSANATIAAIEGISGGQGALIYYDTTNNIRQSIQAAKSALLLCLQTSNSLVTSYTVPVLMSIREVCFANNIPVDNSQDVLTMNPGLLSANYIPQGTVLQIPSA